MNRIIGYTVLASLIGSMPTFAEQVEVECKLVHMPATTAKSLGLQSADGEQTEFQPATFPAESMERFLTASNTDMMSAPRVVTKDGERAIVEIIREVRYPTEFQAEKGGILMPTQFETQNIGFTLEIESNITEDDNIDARIGISISSFDGWTSYKDGKTAIGRGGAIPSGGFILPVISRTQLRSELTLRSDETLLLGGCPTLMIGALPDFAGEGAIKNALKEPEQKRGEPMLQFLFVTLRTLDRNGNPTSGRGGSGAADPFSNLLNAPVDSGTPLPPNNSIPYATPSGKPGFVRSPYAPHQGYVDVRGFPRNVEVKCPYTGKVFLVP